jgi:hypothetical protein
MTDVTYGVDLALPAAESAQAEAENEGKLRSEIQALWSAHQVGKTTSKRTKEELKILRLDLGHKLYELKATLVRTGRGGGWAAYLRLCDLPRATGERYIKQHAALLQPKVIDSPETFSEPSEEDVRRLVRNLMPRLRRVLVTQSWLEWFMAEVEHQWETTDASPGCERVDEAGPCAEDSGDPKTAFVPLFDAASDCGG